MKHQVEVQDTEFASRSEVAINGMAHRNRAVDGDVVVVRLLPRQLWTTASANIAPSEAGTFGTILNVSFPMSMFRGFLNCAVSKFISTLLIP